MVVRRGVRRFAEFGERVKGSSPNNAALFNVMNMERTSAKAKTRALKEKKSAFHVEMAE